MIRIILLTFSLILLFICSQNLVYGDIAYSSAITKWNGDCSGSTRKWWDDMCMAWRKKMGAKGWTQHYANYSYVKAYRYIDSKVFAWGNDRWNFDYADAGLICTHGGHNDDGWYGVLHTRNNGHCNLDLPEMRLGPKLSLIHISDPRD